MPRELERAVDEQHGGGGDDWGDPWRGSGVQGERQRHAYRDWKEPEQQLRGGESGRGIA